MKIELNKFLDVGDRVVVGVSGGADSVCLLHLIYKAKEELCLDIVAAHLHHGIRGDEADRDMEFVKKLCEDLNISFVCKKLDIIKMAAQKGVSVEVMGREARYAFFNEQLPQKIAVAHNKNDLAETILMRMIRGGGSGALGGIKEKRGNIIRPLLDTKRCDIEKYCEENKLIYITDSTNLEAIYTRNKIRLEIIPKLKEMNPSIVDTLANEARILSEDDDYIEKMANESSLDKPGLHPSLAKRILIKKAKEAGAKEISSVQLDALLDLLEGDSGRCVSLGGNVEARKDYDKISFYKKTPKVNFCHRVNLEGETKIPEINAVLICGNEGVLFDKALLKEPIIVRNRKNGDRFNPEGMNGSKKLKDFFIDAKINRDKRDKTPVLEVGGTIAWVAPFRRSRDFVPNENTKEFIRMQIIFKDEGTNND